MKTAYFELYFLFKESTQKVRYEKTSSFFPMESVLIQAAQDGNVSTVTEILESGQVNINCKDI